MATNNHLPEMPVPIVEDLTKATREELVEEVKALRLFIGQLYRLTKNWYTVLDDVRRSYETIVHDYTEQRTQYTVDSNRLKQIENNIDIILSSITEE